MTCSLRSGVVAEYPLNEMCSAARKIRRHRLAVLLIGVCAAVTAGPIVLAAPMVRVGYVVPQNRTTTGLGGFASLPLVPTPKAQSLF